MEESEIRWMKEAMVEIKENVKDVGAAVNDMRVILAGNYVTKQDFEDYKKEEKLNRRWWAGFILTLSGAITALFNLWVRN